MTNTTTTMNPDDYSEAIIESVLNQVSTTCKEMTGESSEIARSTLRLAMLPVSGLEG